MKKILPYESIVAIYKKNTAIVFANAIEIVTQSGKYFFTSFMFRDNAYKLLTQVWGDFVNENSSTGESRVMFKSDGAELFTRHPENEIIVDESEEEKHTNGLISINKKKRYSSPKNFKSLTVKYSTDEEDDGYHEYRSDDDSKKSKKKHKKKKSWPTSKYKSVEPLPDFDSSQEGYINADKLLQQANGKKEDSKTVKKRRESKVSTPTLSRKEKEKTEPSNGISETNITKEEEEDINDEVGIILPINKNCTHIRTEPEKNQTKIHDRTFKVSPSIFFRLTFKNNKFLEEYAEACEYAADWTADEWAPTDSSECCHSRKLYYKIPLNNNIGPKSTRVIATQYARQSSETNILMEMQNVSKDVPFGDSFIVYEIWELKQVESKGIKECNIVIKGGINWKKSVWGLKGTIEKKALEGSKTHGEIFLNLAQKYVDNHLKRRNLFVTTKTKNGGSYDAGKKESIISQPSEEISKLRIRKSSSKKKSKEKEASAEISAPVTHPNEVLLKKVSLIIITLCMIIVTISMIFMALRIGRLEKHIDYDERDLISEIRDQNILLRKLLSLLMNSTDIVNDNV